MLRFAFRYNLVSKWSIVAVLIFQCVLTSDVSIHVVIRKKQEIVSYTVVLAVTRKTEIACTANRCGHMRYQMWITLINTNSDWMSIDSSEMIFMQTLIWTLGCNLLCSD